MSPEIRKQKTEQLEGILKSMNIPRFRKTKVSTPNLRWLARNLGVQNSKHPKYKEAMDLVTFLL